MQERQFGKSKSAIYVFDLVKDNPKLLAKVTRALSSYRNKIKSLKKIDKANFSFYYLLLYDYFQNKIELNYEEKIVTNIKNILIAELNNLRIKRENE